MKQPVVIDLARESEMRSGKNRQTSTMRNWLGTAALVALAALNMASPRADASHDDTHHTDAVNAPFPPGTLSWQLLRQVRLVTEKREGKLVSRPEFSAPVRALDRKQVKIHGFAMPLEAGAAQTHFLISPMPAHCPYCMTQGPDSMIEIVARTPINYRADDPIIISGRLELIDDDSLYYRLTNAESIRN